MTDEQVAKGSLPDTKAKVARETKANLTNNG